jgi:RNA polymerase sigma-70 factor (ECF subfamily)
MSAMRPRILRADSPDASEAIRERLAALFREHYAGLVGFVTRYVHAPDVAEEVVQEVFLRIWTQSEAEGRLEMTRAYLYGAARNQAITLLRHEQVVRRHVARFAHGPEPSSGATQQVEVEADELTRAARRAIAALPERTRLVFLLSRERGLSHQEIAEVLGISLKAVEANVTRALKALRASLGGALGALGLAIHATMRLLE